MRITHLIVRTRVLSSGSAWQLKRGFNANSFARNFVDGFGFQFTRV